MVIFRSSKPNKKDLELIKKSAFLGAEQALNGKSGLVGLDDDTKKLSLIEFDRIKGGKPFDTQTEWYNNMLQEIGQMNKNKWRNNEC